jgi:hypothetical protein
VHLNDQSLIPKALDVSKSGVANCLEFMLPSFGETLEAQGNYMFVILYPQEVQIRF